MSAARRKSAVQAPSGEVLAELDEVASRLSALGMTEQAEKVIRAAETAREDPEKAAAALKDLAAVLAAQVPAYSHGRRDASR